MSRRRVSLGVMALLLALVTLPAALAVSGAQNGRPPRRRLAPAPTAAPSTPPSVPLAVPASGLATTFMNQFLAGDYTDQWPELAPETQAMWPSSVARAAMLQAKFFGASAITSFTVGPVAAGVTWTSQESPTWSVSGAYAVPVAVQFGAPTALATAGVATDYQRGSVVVGEFPIPSQAVEVPTTAPPTSCALSERARPRWTRPSSRRRLRFSVPPTCPP